jgi:hypothetical protein
MSPKERNPNQLPLPLKPAALTVESVAVYEFVPGSEIFRWGNSYKVVTRFDAEAIVKRGGKWTYKAKSSGIVYRGENKNLPAGTKFQAAKK